jgi:tripartite-type tricarboxylate transporter receptor subunit TctC
MTLHRRPALLRLAALALAAATATGNLWAQAYPSKPIRWVVVAPAGSSLDVIARAMQDKLKDSLGQPIVIENRAGAGGTQGTNEVAKSAPDGHTWLMSFNGPLAYAPFLYSKLPYNPSKDLQPVVLTTSQPNLIAVHASFPASTMKELVEVLRANPGKYNFASVGNGSSSHLTMEYVKALTEHVRRAHPLQWRSAGGAVRGQRRQPDPGDGAHGGDAAYRGSGRMKAIAVTGAQRYALARQASPTVSPKAA